MSQTLILVIVVALGIALTFFLMSIAGVSDDGVSSSGGGGGDGGGGGGDGDGGGGDGGD